MLEKHRIYLTKRDQREREEMSLQEEGDDYTKDGTVDLRGNPVRRSQRGRWKACSFVIGMNYNFPYF